MTPSPLARPRVLQNVLHEARATLGAPPYGLLDLDAVRSNARELTRRAQGKPIRVATKSIRCRAVLDELLATDGYRGLLTLTLSEALELHARGYRDLVVGYPSTDQDALRRLARDEAACADITLMFDSAEQLDFTDAVIPPERRPELRVCLELDASWKAGPLHIGARRSPLFRPDQFRSFAATVQRRPGYAPVGVMAYEAQLAGVYDGGHTPRAYGVRWMQRASRAELLERRVAAVAAVKQVFEPEFVNGGGTGSIPYTAADPQVTEIAAGSGIYAPGLFSRYRDLPLRPAAFYACPVVRRPAPDIVTVAGAGWVASGVPGPDRLPTIAYPPGLHFVVNESAGEAQTPLQGSDARTLAIGDLVLFRHAKAGELCERINEFIVVTGDTDTDRWPTYRGDGLVLQ
ncbi:alanine racemase [Yinghuangia seranimata]|uniref:alanine racemase n=1 Tax=Yinghuangia seranimata TaxID=408067 RepID=UPI00248BC324|nr:alanine racemase [Yinghuangia seranimata]MDI2128351.1 alanine racemase [Yinghuangia seranimata]